MALLLKDSFELVTPLGKREIQLLVGDITKLDVTQKVDIVITSAYYGDYSPIATTLIGSLKNNLDISVHQLAMDKDVDLRSQFSCWISKPLQPHLPFHRLVCFENVKRAFNLTEQISNMFRAMMPIFNNKDTTVITPLLATGDQGHSSLKVMTGMVNAACEWIKAGLPLKCLKLVVYSSNPSKTSNLNLECVEWFSNLKKTWLELENISDPDSGPHDVCLSWSPENKELAQCVSEHLLKENSTLKIFSDPFVYNHEDVWQKQIFNVMKNCKRIIVILTPSYITNPECLEHFSIALCCNRLKQEEVLVPFYLETISSLPSYMVLVQYIDCRVRKPGQTQESLLEKACSQILNPAHFYHPDSSSLSNKADDLNSEVLQRNRSVRYDIFVSYSHSHVKEPRELVEILQREYPEMNIFFDVSELRAGNLWQQVLYETVGKALCVVAFISSTYLTSSVCQEEFNIALGRHFVQDSMILVPVHQASAEYAPESYTSIPLVDMRNEKMETLAEKLVQMAKLKQNNNSIVDLNLLKQEMESKRGSEFKEKFKFEGGHVVKTLLAETEHLKGQVVFSYAPEMVCLAAIMSAIMKKHAPRLTFHLLSSSQSQRRLHLDSADLVVVFMSDEYLSSPSLVDELHTVLCRQRRVKDSTIVYLIQCNHKKIVPVYLHLLPFNISLDDKFWQRLKVASGNKNPKYEVDIDGMAGIYRCTPDQNLALTAAAHDAIFTVSMKGQGSDFICSIENIYRLQKEVQKIPDENVAIKNHLVTLSAFVSHIERKHGLTELPAIAKSKKNKEKDNTSQEVVNANDQTDDQYFTAKRKTSYKPNGISMNARRIKRDSLMCSIL